MKLKNIILYVLIAACIITGGFLLYMEWDGRQEPEILYQEGTGADTMPIPSSYIINNEKLQITDVPTPSQETENSDQSGRYEQKNNSIGTLTILGREFPIKHGVDEATLKGNIGWMESSAMPGEDGMCILMGHRNQQFRILKDIKKGDAIQFTYPNKESYTYKVQSAKIVDSDKALRFEAMEGKTLVLVTCYPFYYRGHAPQKFIVRAVAY